MPSPDTILRADNRLFNPFRAGNVLPKLDASLTLTDPTLAVHAASAFYPVTAAILQSVYDPAFFRDEPDRTLTKVSTAVGFADIISGASDILFATSPSEEQRAAMDASGLVFRYLPVCEEPLAILVNRANPVDGLSVEQLRAMYFDELISWWEAGGRDLPVHTYQLVKNNGSQTAFEHIVKNNPLSERHREIETMPAIVDAVAEDEAGICYAYWSYYAKMYANRNTKLLNIGGRGPEAADYPLRWPMYMIFREDNPKKDVRALADWLVTDEGRMVVREGNRCWRSV